MFAFSVLSAALVTAAIASPVDILESRALKEYTPHPTIHESCNATETRALLKAFDDTWDIVSNAHNYIKTNGPDDPIFQLYFGKEPLAYTTALGAYDALMEGNKKEVIFRCDDPDNNCPVHPQWTSYWRGKEHGNEVGVCDNAYVALKYNEMFCLFNYKLSETLPDYYWGIDLMHRFYHIASTTNYYVDHYAKDLDGILTNAQKNGTVAPIDSDALQYFSAHVYIIEVVKGGDGCIGTVEIGKTNDLRSHL